MNEYCPAFISLQPPFRKQENIQVLEGEAGVQIFRPPPPSQRGAIFSSVTEKLWQISKGILDRSDRLRHRFNLTSRFGSPESLCFTVEVRDSSQFSLHCYFGKGSKEMKGME
ncbi:hypothetical protein CDAR_273011 [Caerostris darwini]|uniref:Uncharacterized protein n=1 Tax=Caerostris darwini TaxID=1538125 RepID=A0AAV4MFM9_9ARAC|nr:hypothetical protein CDAR_273011 [Caerostris darwini]